MKRLFVFHIDFFKKKYFAAKNKANSFLTRARSGSTRFHVMSILNKNSTRLTEPEAGQPASCNHPLTIETYESSNLDHVTNISN